MRIHTNLVRAQVEAIPLWSGTSMHALTEHGSRSRLRAFEVVLSGSSVYGGQYGHLNYSAATWDEWGVFLGHLLDRDPTARIINVYEGRDDFHYITDGRYRPGVLATLCPRHRWLYDGPYQFSCRKCDARLFRHDRPVGDQNTMAARGVAS